MLVISTDYQLTVVAMAKMHAIVAENNGKKFVKTIQIIRIIIFILQVVVFN